MRLGAKVVTGMFLLSGILHLVTPGGFEWLMPPWLPAHTELIIASGIAELVCAVGLMMKARWAHWATAAVLVGVFPANIWFAVAGVAQAEPWLVAAAWIRLPLQLPLIYWAITAYAPRKSAE